MISWKYSFNRLNEEFEMAKKKKQALDNLFETGRISQTTHDSFNNDINSVITEIEKQQIALLNKMQNTTQELDDQVKILESLFTNYEIQHAVGEIEEETYQSEIHLLSSGLETAKRELTKIKDAIYQLTPPLEPQSAEPAIDIILNENELSEEAISTLENPENLPETTEDIESTPEPCTPEPSLIIDAPIPEAPEIETITNIDQEPPQITDESVQVDDVVPEAVEGELQVDESVQVDDNAPETMQEETQTDTPNQENKTTTENESDEWPQFVEEPVKFDDSPEIIENEPLFIESTTQTNEDAPQETITEEQENLTIENLNEQKDQIENPTAVTETEENTENTEQY
ncbi:MAG: CdvA-like protein [Candidatus Bathyarchaeota archaeon]|nr:CdvA-like protein [Candidatus Bathyarchaeota archaeon]